MFAILVTMQNGRKFWLRSAADVRHDVRLPKDIAEIVAAALNTHGLQNAWKPGWAGAMRIKIAEVVSLEGLEQCGI